MFAKEFLRSHRQTGAVAPSGEALARALTRYVRPDHRTGTPRAVLEVGPGTGSVTRHIAARLGPRDTLDLVEANPRFASRLSAALVDDPALRPAADRIRVHAGLIQEWPLDRYDAIVCGLPFANFDPDTVRSILRVLLGALAPDGTLSFFAYAGLPALRRSLTTGRAHAQSVAVQGVLAAVLRDHRFRHEFVPANLPPARVHHLAATPTRVVAAAL
ncbi:methyltransferase domain-containing protein [Kitasatospora sp. SUK 42]|nr:methyltransferase domain-containing protein [Kitasatospora sp. SUK 42]